MNEINVSKKTCPLCKEDLPQEMIFYCPNCKMEIDYLLHQNVESVSEEKKQEMIQNTSKIRYDYLLIIGVYLIIWGFLYFAVLKDNMVIFR